MAGCGNPSDQRRESAGGAADDDVLRGSRLQPDRIDEHVKEHRRHSATKGTVRRGARRRGSRQADQQIAAVGDRRVSHQAAEDLKSAAGVVADEWKSVAGAKAEEYRGKAEQAWDDARERARTLQEDGEQYIRENPTKAVFTALAIGFVLGLIFRR